jgi:hypothetical protein
MNVAGPQKNRDLNWMGSGIKNNTSSSIENSNDSIEREDFSSIHIENDSEKKIYESEISKVRKENLSLRDQLQRALKEIKHYQIKYPNQLNSSDNFNGQVDELPPWTTTPDIVTPIFEAYDTRIKEMENMVQQLESQMRNCNEKAESLVIENDHLRETQLESLRNAEHSNKLHGSNINPMESLNLELVSEMTERVEILMSENGLLVEQKLLLSVELDNHQNELMSRTSEITSLSQQLTKFKRDLNNEINKRKHSESDRDEAAGQAVGYSDALGRCENDIDILQSKLNLMEEKYNQSELNLNKLNAESKKELENFDSELYSNIKRTKLSEDRVKELHLSLLQKTKDLDISNELVRKLKREYASTRQDAEGMLQVMGGLERQVSAYSAREADVERIVRDSKEKLENSLTERDKAVAREEITKKEVENLTNERKKYISQREDDIEISVAQVRQRMQIQLQQYEIDLNNLSERNATLMSDKEKIIRESKSGKEMNEKRNKILEDERKTVEGIIKTLSDKLNICITSKEEETSRRIDLQDTNKDLRNTIDKLRLQLESLHSQQLQSQRTQDSELSSSKQLLRETQRELSEKTRILIRKNKELDDIKDSIEINSSMSEKKFAEENVMYRRRALEADKNYVDLESTSSINEKRSQQTIDKIKEKYENMTVQIDAKLQEEININRKIKSSNVNLMEEKNELIGVIKEARLTIGQLQDELEEKNSLVFDHLKHSSNKSKNKIEKKSNNKDWPGSDNNNNIGEEVEVYMDMQDSDEEE